MKSSLRQSYEEMQAERKTAWVVLFVAVVEILIHIWTATHNIPLLSGGIDAELRPIGILAAITGEVFSVGMLIFAWILSG
ncbi:MAG: hypothetical protein N2559_17480 [Anaerolineae bacterium]|nr:hypothetical protein [Anaerolineae bacterium]